MTAIFSECRKYRYRLDRVIKETGSTMAFFGINPSTANEQENDRTINKMIGFAARNGAARLIVANVFSLVSTDINGLRMDVPLRGDEHDEYIQHIINDADILVPCWGCRHKLASRFRSSLDEYMTLLLKSQKPVYCLGRTKTTGDPLHPLMLGYNTKMIEWS